MNPSNISEVLSTIQALQLSNGGFANQTGGEARSDSTAWAIIALSLFGTAAEYCAKGRAYLKTQQLLDDGRLPLSSVHPEATWPTSLAIFAWQTDPSFYPPQLQAVKFLLGFSGRHFRKQNENSASHDPSIRGWPWIANTHSWVIPTSMAMTALKIAGFGTHHRVLEAERMLLDRQLPSGGWNYGNTLVFGKELHALPECTAIALQGLGERTGLGEIQKSLNYLLEELPRLRTPISLGWAILGLGAWGLRPQNVEDRMQDCLKLQKRYGSYSLASLALMLCALKAQSGFCSLFEDYTQPHYHISSS